jgi:hypothetical protein
MNKPWVIHLAPLCEQHGDLIFEQVARFLLQTGIAVILEPEENLTDFHDEEFWQCPLCLKEQTIQ